MSKFEIIFTLFQMGFDIFVICYILKLWKSRRKQH